MKKCTILYLLFVSAVSAWAPIELHSTKSLLSSKKITSCCDLVHKRIQYAEEQKDPVAGIKTLLLPGLVYSTPSIASAATAFTSNALPSALAAYGHYFSILGLVACLVAERLTIKPNMSEEDEDFLALADIVYGGFGALLVYTGYLRTTAFEKGWEFYSHEPIFWLKITLAAIYSAVSFFNTTKIIQRSVARRNGDVEPMGEALAGRMKQICNAQLLMIGSIPITATLMARGVGYNNDFPWQIEAGLAFTVFAGFSFKYIKEAFEFEDNPKELEVL